MEKCTTHTLNVSDLAVSSQDPAFNRLLQDGWEPVCSVVLADQSGTTPPKLHLVLKPPHISNKPDPVVIYHRAMVILLALNTVIMAGVLASLVR